MFRFCTESFARSICSIAALGLVGLWSLPVLAQDAASDEIEEVVVTGSRIKRSSLEAAVPIMTLGSEDLELSGNIELSRLIRELPSIYEGTSTENSQSSTQNSGGATIELRNLGEDRTLVLIDGRRTVSNSSTANVVSLDTIPKGFIERVEVMTGGASAIYGSDAVTGVVNIITKDDFEGFEVGARVGTSQDGGGDEFQFEMTLGANFANERGNVLVNYTYDRGDAIYGRDRNWATIPLDIDGDPALSGNIPGGRFLGSDWYYQPDTNVLTQDFDSDVDGYNGRFDPTMRIEKERNLLAAKISYDLTENTTAFFHTQYSHVWTLSNRAPDTASSSRLSTEIPLNNPFIPAEILAQAMADGETGIDFRRRWTEIGPRNRGGDRDTTRTWFGLDGSFNDNWEWSTFFGYHEFRQAQNRVGDLVVPKFRDAVNVEPDPDNPGEFRCADSRARLGGCVPINVFGIGSVTPEAINWVIYQDALRATNEEKQAAFYVTGDLVDMPAGPLAIAAGVEYRDVETRTVWDPIANGGLGTVTQQVDQFGTFDVTEVYVEGSVPIFEGFTLELAARAASYDQPTVDHTSSYRFGFNWQAVDALRFRAMFSTAERAPNTIELFSRGIGNQGPLDDPCDGVTLASAGVADDNCRGVPEVLANIQANGSFTRDVTDQIQAPLTGNQLLVEETAETFTVGFVLTPPAIEGLSITLDYYDIEIEDAISDIDEQDILDLCFEDPTFDPNNDFCSQINRETTTGEVFLIDRKRLNVNTLRATGIDTTVDYNFDVNFMPGDFDFRLSHSYVDTLEQDFNAPAGPETEIFVGEVPFPETRWRATLGWAINDWYVRWKTIYWGEVTDGEELANGSILGADGHWKSDLYASYNMEWPGSNNSTVYVGINNVFDEDPPLFLDGSEYGNDTNTNSSYDIVGRYFYLGFDTRF